MQFLYKLFFTIVIATLLALFGAFLILNFNNKEVKSIENQEKVFQQEELLDNETIDESVNLKADSVEEEKPVFKIEPKKDVPVVTNQVKKEEIPVKKPIQVEEVKVVENKIEEHKEDCGIIKDSKTEEIVITREFKSATPNKYSFK